MILNRKIRPLRMLYIEDDDVTVKMVQAALESIKSVEVKLTVAEDGEKGLERLNNGRDKFDLVVSDVNLPRIHGLDVLKAIKENDKTKNIPIIMFSTTSDSSRRAYELGANSYIVKPAQFEDYKNTIRSICEFWSQNCRLD